MSVKPPTPVRFMTLLGPSSAQTYLPYGIVNTGMNDLGEFPVHVSHDETIVDIRLRLPQANYGKHPQNRKYIAYPISTRGPNQAIGSIHRKFNIWIMVPEIYEQTDRDRQTKKQTCLLQYFATLPRLE